MLAYLVPLSLALVICNKVVASISCRYRMLVSVHHQSVCVV
jgi:hypothetical protein